MKMIYTLVLVTLLAGASKATAQQPRLPSSPPPVNPAAGLPGSPSPLPPKDPEPTFDLDFKGGKPSDLLRAIEEVAGARPNVIIQPDCANSEFPKFQLRNVSASQVFQALNGVSDIAKEGFWRPADGRSEIWLLMRETRQGPNFAPPPFNPPASREMPKPTPVRQCKIFNLGPYLGSYSVEDITTAVQGAWELMKASEGRSIKYHKDTKLLIVVGEPEHLNVVADVLRELASTSAPVDLKPAKEKAPVDPTVAPAAKKL